MQCEVVRCRIKLFQRHQLDSQLAGHGSGHERIMRYHFHAEGARPLGHFQSHAPQPDNAQRLAAQLRALQRFLLPLAGTRGGVGPRKMPRQRQHQRKSMLGHGNRVRARGVHHRDAAASSGFQINVVHAHAGAADHPQLGGVRKQIGIHIHRRTHQQGIGIAHLLGQIAVDLLSRHHLPLLLFAKQVDGRRRGFFCDNNFHGRNNLKRTEGIASYARAISASG